MEPLNKCPECKSEEIKRGDPHMEGNDIWRKCKCESCGFVWQEFYVLVCNENADTGEEIIAKD